MLNETNEFESVELNVENKQSYVNTQENNKAPGLRKRLVSSFTNKFNVQLGGDQMDSGFDVSKKSLVRAKILLIAIFLIFIGIVGILYNRHRISYGPSGKLHLDTVSKELTPYTSPEDFVNRTLSCVSPSERLLKTWIDTNESCSHGVCLNFHELTDWQSSSLNKNSEWLNSVCTAFMTVHTPNGSLFNMPCACTVSLSNGTEIFMIDPRIISSGEAVASVVDRLPIVNVKNAKRKIPIWIGLEYSPWPPKGRKWENVEIRGRDVNIVLRMIDLMNRNQEKLSN